MRVLACDVGGTNARFRLLEGEPSALHAGREATSSSASFASFADAARAFLGDEPAPDVACVAVAGPVVDGRCHTTNLPWELDQGDLSRALSIPRVRVVNDFYAVARGLARLCADDLHVLRTGEVEVDGPRLCVGAGTGLGVAVLPSPSDARVLASEGGHTAFAPRDELEDELLRFLRARHGRVSTERVISGPGLGALYDFYCETGRITRRVEDGPEAPVEISAAAASDPGARLVVQHFCALYGAAVGDLALTVLPKGGLYLAGGIAPKLLRGANADRFLEAFGDKGRMRPLLEATRVSIVLAGDVGLRGATAAALD